MQSDTPTHLSQPMELPALGFPMAEEALTAWFREAHGREPSSLELGSIMAAMAARVASPPYEGPEAEPDGWRSNLTGSPAAHR